MEFETTTEQDLANALEQAITIDHNELREFEEQMSQSYIVSLLPPLEQGQARRVLGYTTQGCTTLEISEFKGIKSLSFVAWILGVNRTTGDTRLVRSKPVNIAATRLSADHLVNAVSDIASMIK